MSEDAAASRPFKRPMWRRSRVPLAPERVDRQSRITHLAFLRLDGRDAALSFLNTHNASLGGRPLDLAMENAEGFGRVEEAILLLARPVSGGMQ